MVNVKEAVKSAATFTSDMFEDARDIRLEEVEFNNQTGEWDVVISYLVPQLLGTLSFGGPTQERIWKEIRVDSNNGEPLSLKSFKV